MVNQKNRHGGARLGSGRSNSGWYKGYYCGSTYELAWVVYNIDHAITFERCTEYFTYAGTKRYYPDFKLTDSNLYIEIKGYVADQTTLAQKLEAVRQAGKNISLLMREDLEAQFDWVKSVHKVCKLETLYDKTLSSRQVKGVCSQCRASFTRLQRGSRTVKYCSQSCAAKGNRGVFEEKRLANLKAAKKAASYKPKVLSEAHKLKIGRKLQAAHKTSPRAWVTNGEINLMISAKEAVAFCKLGFSRGRKFGAPTGTRTQFSGLKDQKSNP